MTSYSSTRVLTVPQYARIQGISVDDIPPLRLSKLLKDFITLSSRSDPKSLSTKGNIGLVQLNDSVLLNVVPRFQTRNLTYMVDFCNGSWVNAIDGEYRNYFVSQSPADWARSLLKTEYVKHCQLLYSTGLLREYRRKEIETSSPYGRIDVSRSLSLKWRGITRRLACSYAERTIDNLPNSCLLLALQNSEIPSKPLHERERMRLIPLFDGVSHRSKQECLSFLASTNRPPLPPNWLAYRELLDTAALLIDGGTLLLEGVPEYGRRLPSLQLDFQHLFEDFIRESIRRSLSGRYIVSDGNAVSGKVPLYEDFAEHENICGARILSGSTSHTADCDILIKDPKSRDVLLTIECKCTPLDSDGYPKRNEVEQAILYAVRFGTPFAFLVHPVTTQEDAGLETPGRIGRIPVIQYNFNLDAEDMAKETESMMSSLNQLLDVSIKQRPQIDSYTV